jgi:group II intron reverse transcriptase/maturase
MYLRTITKKRVRRVKLPLQPFHIVDQSPWPILLTGVLFMLTTGAVLSFQNYPIGDLLLALSFLLLGWSFGLWFKDIITEASYLGAHTDKVQKGLSLGVVLWASVRIFIKLITIIRCSRWQRRMRILSYIRVNNLIACKSKETIAWYVKWENAEDLTIDYLYFQYSYTAFIFKNYPWLTLYLWNVSLFWYNTTAGYVLNTRQIKDILSKKSSDKANLLSFNYPLVLGTVNENTTIDNKWNSSIDNEDYLTSVINVTGEIHSTSCPRARRGMEVRGFIVIWHNSKTWQIKESKSRLTLSRAYSTSSKELKASQSIMNENRETYLAFELIARLWISNYKKPNKVYKSLKAILNTKELWYASYIIVRSSRGSETTGIDLNTLDRTTRFKLDTLREKVISKNYKFKSPGKTRPLGIPTLNDRIVQEVLRSILEPIFEPLFSDRSHGFRPGRSCHTALKYVNTQFKAVAWYIEGDISKYFDTINHNILLHLLRRKIRDKLILNLIESGLKANIIFNNREIEHISGTPHLSPLLSNIYLNELDKYIEKLESEYLGPSKTPKANPAYSKLMNNQTNNWNPKLARKLKIHKSDPFDPLYRHIRYVRFGDDFLIGVLGPKSLAVEIRKRISEFLETKLVLKLNFEKTKITNVSKKVPFLGYLIGRRFVMTKQRYGKLKKWIPRICLDGDVGKMIKNLAKNGFCDKSGFPLPNFSLLMLPQSEINARINSIITDISNWWSIAGNRKRGVAYISYILRFSTAKLYAAKFKLKSISKVFKKGGKALGRPLSSNKRSVVGVTDERINNWFNQSDMNSGTVEREISGILYSKYKEIPEPDGNKLKPDWQPDFVKYLKSETDISKLIKTMVDNKLSSKESNPLALLGWRMSRGI